LEFSFSNWRARQISSYSYLTSSFVLVAVGVLVGQDPYDLPGSFVVNEPLGALGREEKVGGHDDRRKLPEHIQGARHRPSEGAHDRIP
jgi:hypothetical protein